MNTAPEAGASPSPPTQHRGLTSLAPGQADSISLKYRWVPYISPRNLIGSDCCWRSAGRNGSPV